MGNIARIIRLAMQTLPVIIGLDISKQKIDCCIDRQGIFQYLIIENSKNGYHTLINLLADATEVHACCEATNVYWQGIANYLYARQIKISVVNPASIKAYSKLKLTRIKTDKQDAKLIADYCRQCNPQAWQPDSDVKVAIKSLYRRICQLNQMLIADKLRLQTADNYAKQSIQRMLNIIKQEIDDCREQMQNIIQQHEELKHQQDILQTIPGIGKQTAQVLLAVTGDLHKYPTAKHLISWLGLSPVVRQSGKSHGTARLSKMGNSAFRRALYMPARAACLNSKLWRGWFDYQIGRGKAPKQVYVMMMCKLVKYAYACLKNNQPFDADKHMKRLKALNNA